MEVLTTVVIAVIAPDAFEVISFGKSWLQINVCGQIG
jgi:hypothetical protein